MKLYDLKNALSQTEELVFVKENGTEVPRHFHVTEVGTIIKKFIDCGGTLRSEEVINLQLWNANDTEHRLEPLKLVKILDMAEQQLEMTNREIEVEYQGETIEKLGLDFNEGKFILTNKSTACLALELCGLPVQESKEAASCTPGGGCC